MMLRSTPERSGGSSWPGAWDVGWVLVSTVAFGEASIAFLSGGYDYQRWRHVLLLLIASALLAAACYLIGNAAAHAWGRAVRGREERANLTVGFVVGLGLLSLEVTRYVQAPTPAFLLLQISFALGVSILLALLLPPGILATSEWRGFWTIVGRALPWLGLEIMVFLWYHRYRLTGLADFSTAGIVSDLMFILVLVVTLGIVSKAPRRWAIRANAFLAIAIVLAPFLSNLAGTPPAATKGHEIRRVILITIDTLRRDRLTCYSETAPPTPAIDAFAAQAVRFDRARSPAPWTLPSFASIMTGYPVMVHGTRFRSSRLPSGFETLAQRLRAAGYRTAAIGDNPYLAPRWGFTRGFDEYRFYPRRLGPSLALQAAAKVWPEAYRSQITTQEIAENAIRWARRNKKEDFFLWVHFLDPHQPYTPPREFLPDGEPPIGLSRKFEAPAKGDLLNDFNPPSYRRRWIEKLYDGEVRYVDRWVGRLLKALEEMDLYDESLVVLTSDHGEEFWEHGAWEHCHTLYDELLRVPLLIKPPEISGGRVVKQPVSLTALYATILDYCGLEIPASPLLESSLRPWVEREAEAGSGTSIGKEKPLLAGGIVRRPNATALLYNRYKYIWWPETGEERIYDLEKDPGERMPLPLGDYETFLRMVRADMDSLLEAADSLRAVYRVGKEGAGDLDKATIEKLRALGYIR